MSLDDGGENSASESGARASEPGPAEDSNAKSEHGRMESADPAQAHAEADDGAATDDGIGMTEVGGPINASNIGYKMLLGLGWKSGRGLGSKGQGKLEPLSTQGDQYGEKGAGLRHVSEIFKVQERIDPSKLESWEIEEKTADFFKGCYSSMWRHAGTLEEQGGLRDHAPAQAASSPVFQTYQDAWDDKQVSELHRPSSFGNRENEESDTWEDTWAEGVNSDLARLTVNAEHFFACCAVAGPVVHLYALRSLAVEETGEVFRYKVWAESSKALRKVMETRLQSGLRVMRPVFRGAGDHMRSVYAVVRAVRGSDESGLNQEASRVAGCSLYGQVYLICRGARRTVLDYSLPQYLQDFRNP